MPPCSMSLGGSLQVTGSINHSHDVCTLAPHQVIPSQDTYSIGGGGGGGTPYAIHQSCRIHGMSWTLGL
eukprot:3365815-Amphidinium_carterae.1